MLTELESTKHAKCCLCKALEDLREDASICSNWLHNHCRYHSMLYEVLLNMSTLVFAYCSNMSVKGAILVTITHIESLILKDGCT